VSTLFRGRALGVVHSALLLLIDAVSVGIAPEHAVPLFTTRSAYSPGLGRDDAERVLLFLLLFWDDDGMIYGDSPPSLGASLWAMSPRMNVDELVS